MGRFSWLRVREPSQGLDKGTNQAQIKKKFRKTGKKYSDDLCEVYQAQIKKNSGRQEKNIVTIFVKFRWKLNWRFPLRSGKTDITEPVSYHTDDMKLAHFTSLDKSKRVRPVSNVVLLPCRTQFINYKYIRIHLKVC